MPPRTWKKRLGEPAFRLLYRLNGIEAINRQLGTTTTLVPALLELFGAEIHADVGVLHGPITIHNAATDYRNLSIGARVHLGREVFVDLTAPVTIERDATVSMRCMILTHQDVGARPLASRHRRRVAPTTIGAGSYLGANVTVLAGCDIGEQAVVGAGAVVTRPVPAGETWAGVPARPIRE